MYLLFLIILTCAFFSFLLSLPFLIRFRKYAHWELWELSAFVLPIIVWSLLFNNNSIGKTLANLSEAGNLIFLTPVTVGVRGLLGKAKWRISISVILQTILILFAIFSYLFTPALPESSIEQPNEIYALFSNAITILSIILCVIIWFWGNKRVKSQIAATTNGK